MTENGRNNFVDPRLFLFLRNQFGTRPGALSTDIEDIRSFSQHPGSLVQNSLTFQHSACTIEGIRCDIEDAHDHWPVQSEKFPLDIECISRFYHTG